MSIRKVFSECGILLFVSIVCCARAFAHPVAQGSMIVTCRGKFIDLAMRASTEQVTVEQMNNVLSINTPREGQWKSHAAYILQHLDIRSADHKLSGALEGEDNPRQEGSFINFHFLFEGWDSNQPLVLQQNLLNEFEFAPGNPWEATFLVDVRCPNVALTAPFLLAPRIPLTIDVRMEQAALPAIRLFTDYFQLGLHHIFTGYDHLLFASALVVNAVRFWDVVVLVATFTTAHTVTLVLSTLNIVHLPAWVVEPLIALSIVVVALFNLFPRRAHARRTIAILAFMFGLFHGLGFAGALVEVLQSFPAANLSVALLGFSAGVEFGHQAVVIPLFCFMTFARFADRFRSLHRTSAVTGYSLSVGIAIGGVYFLYHVLSGT